MTNLIKVENLGKKFSRYGQDFSTETIREAVATLFSGIGSKLGGKQPETPKEFWAFRHLDFTVDQGDVVGIVGRNGAGKTTLLRILSQITLPSEGRIEIRGRVGTLLGAAAGFAPELTGRENVHLSAAMLGIDSSQVKKSFNEIADFSEIGPFLDTPVKRYSMGMRARLGFAVSAFLLPDILILDEVLSVGDISFQERALNRTREVAESGHTILFVSHNLEEISVLCKKVLILHEGKAAYFGETKSGIQKYIDLMHTQDKANLSDPQKRSGTGEIRCLDLQVGSENKSSVSWGQPLRISLGYQAKKSGLTGVVVSITVRSTAGDPVLHLRNDLAGAAFSNLPQNGRIVCKVPQFHLSPGAYELSVRIDVNAVLADQLEKITELHVQSSPTREEQQSSYGAFRGVLLPQQWSCEK